MESMAWTGLRGFLRGRCITDHILECDGSKLCCDEKRSHRQRWKYCSYIYTKKMCASRQLLHESVQQNATYCQKYTKNIERRQLDVEEDCGEYDDDDPPEHIQHCVRHQRCA